MNKIKYFETENGETIKTAEFDGYNFADRLLEGVMFQATVQEDGTLKVNVSPDSESYFANFNQEKFLEQALKYANNEVEFYVPGTDENCVAVYETDEEEESVAIEATPIAIDKLNIFGTQGEDAVEPEEVKEPVIGQFKTKKNFLNFISAASIRGQNVRFNADFAFIKGEVLSGMLEKAVFKLTICDEGTINFEEVEGTSLSDEAMRKRLVSDIDDSDVTGYAQKFVLNGLEFSDEDGNRCYLEVEQKKPIDLLRSIFDEEDQKEEEMKELSEKGLSVLDSLFADEEQTEEGGLSFLDELLSGDTTVEPFSDEDEVVEVEVVEEPKSQSVSYLEESFRKMNDGKVNELKNRIEEANKEIGKSKIEIKNAETKLNKTQEELGVLETRLETMQPTEEPNGYVFFVSEEKKHETGLDESTKHVADKIADIMKLKKDVLFEMLTEGYHLIKLAKKDSDYSVDLGSIPTDGKTKEEIEELVSQVSELNEMYSSLLKIDRVGKFTQTDEGIEYRGELNWHQLVSKLIRNGFEQDHEFDKVSGSNSYVNTTESYYEETEEETNEVTDEDFEDLDDSKDDYKTQKFMTFDESTDLIFWSAPEEANQSVDISITDDFATLEVRVGGKHLNDIETVGFVSVSTFKEYEKFIKKYTAEQLGGTTAILIPNFQGEIRIGVKLDKGGYATDFDPTDDLYYIQGGGQPFIDFPVDTEIIDIDEDHDLSKLKKFVRDQKLTNLGI